MSLSHHFLPFSSVVNALSQLFSPEAAASKLTLEQGGDELLTLLFYLEAPVLSWVAPALTVRSQGNSLIPRPPGQICPWLWSRVVGPSSPVKSRVTRVFQGSCPSPWACGSGCDFSLSGCSLSLSTSCRWPGARPHPCRPRSLISKRVGSDFPKAHYLGLPVTLRSRTLHSPPHTPACRLSQVYEQY